MAEPKHQTSKGRKNRRRSHIKNIDSPKTVKCKSCGNLKLPHRECEHCGKYVK